MRNHRSDTSVRTYLQGGAILVSILALGLAAGQAEAQEVRFQLRSGTVICGTVVSEQGINIVVHAANGTQINLRRDQIARRQNEPCSTPAINGSAAAPFVSPTILVAVTPAVSIQPSNPAAATPQGVLRDLRFAGSSTIGARLVPDLIDAYMGGVGLRPKGWELGQRPGERVHEGRSQDGNGMRASVEVVGTGVALSALGEQRVDFGMASRDVTADEVAALQSTIGVNVTSLGHQHVLAVDGLAIIVHADNPVQKLTVEQIRGIFSGQFTNWAHVGGPSRPIAVFALKEDGGSATDALFERDVMLDKPMVRTARRLPSQLDIATEVASELGSIGTVSMAYLGRTRPLNLVAACGLEYEASEFAIKAEDYPLARPLYLFSGQSGGNPLADEFLRWATSAPATETVRDAGYISAAPVVGTREYTLFRLADAARAAPGAPDGRYSEMMMQYSLSVRSMLRLSTTLRFENKSHLLNTRSQADIERVAEFLSLPDSKGYRVNILGFSDNAGALGQNRTLSERRANEVAQVLRQRGVTVQASRGFAHVAPVVCDDDPHALRMNNRVEIWLGRT